MPRPPFPVAPKSWSGPNSKQWFTTYFLQEAGAGKRCSECGSGPDGLFGVALKRLIGGSSSSLLTSGNAAMELRW